MSEFYLYSPFPLTSDPAAATPARRSGKPTYGKGGPSAIQAVLSRYVQSAYFSESYMLNLLLQCVEEGWMEKMKEQNTEGCRLSGRVRVNKVGLHRCT